MSICAKDSGGPYDYRVTTALVQAARQAGAQYAVDVYPHYGSDAEASLSAGYDVRHGLIGAGVTLHTVMSARISTAFRIH